MFACVDVDYRGSFAVAGCVLFERWTDASAARELSARIDSIEDYQPGEFYKRELPCILRVLEQVEAPLDTIVIDGYVWLDAGARPGLGARLYAALGERTPVVGVAKTAFRGADGAAEVLRGKSEKPLYVTAAGLGAEQAAALIRSMHGKYRIPTLLAAVDRLCRSAS